MSLKVVIFIEVVLPFAVVGVRDNKLWYHFEGETGARFLDSAFTRCSVDASDNVPYQTCSSDDNGEGELHRYDMRDSTCSEYGFLAGERVKIDERYAIGMKTTCCF